MDYDRFSHKIFFHDVLSYIERMRWKDFDYHRDKYTSSLNRIKNIEWREVDEEKYEKIFGEENTKSDVPMLRSSRYCHRTYTKCFPSSTTCYECYKYFCSCCGEGTNCMYGEACTNKRCYSTINKCYKDIFDIESKSKYVYMYTPQNTFFNEKPHLCSREIYGY